MWVQTEPVGLLIVRDMILSKFVYCVSITYAMTDKSDHWTSINILWNIRVHSLEIYELWRRHKRMIQCVKPKCWYRGYKFNRKSINSDSRCRRLQYAQYPKAFHIVENFNKQKTQKQSTFWKPSISWAPNSLESVNCNQSN